MSKYLYVLVLCGVKAIHHRKWRNKHSERPAECMCVYILVCVITEDEEQQFAHHLKWG